MNNGGPSALPDPHNGERAESQVFSHSMRHNGRAAAAVDSFVASAKSLSLAPGGPALVNRAQERNRRCTAGGFETSIGYDHPHEAWRSLNDG